MSSTLSPPFSIIPVPRDRHNHIFKAHIIVHILVLSTVVFLLMQLVSHTTAVEEVEVFEMPPPWKKMFVGQLFEGTKIFSWVIVYLFVPLDGLHALLCIGWYADRLHPTRKRRNAGWRRMATKTWLDGIWQSLKVRRQQHLGSFETRDGEEGSQKPAHDTECRSTQPQAAPRDCTSSHRLENSDITPSPPSPLGPHTYHPLLHPTYTPLTRHILFALWDTIMFLTLSSHIYTYTANIHPSLAFCSKHDYPLWHFRPHSLTLQERCKRINWSIHSAGGCSATGAVALALWHICTLAVRLWGVVDARLVSRLSSGRLRELKTKLRAGKNRASGVSVGMLDWQYPPRDVDVRSRSTRKSVGSRTLTGTEVASRHLPTVSQEEMGIGLGRRRKWKRERKSDTSSNSDREAEVRSSWWSWGSEGLFECLA